jgi:hypothetical protein
MLGKNGCAVVPRVAARGKTRPRQSQSSRDGFFRCRVVRGLWEMLVASHKSSDGVRSEEKCQPDISGGSIQTKVWINLCWGAHDKMQI